MNADRTVRVGLRLVATTIALLAFVDPAIASSGVDRPTVFVLAADSAQDGALAARVASALGKRFVVSRVPIADADAAVIVGATAPMGDALPTPTFAVEPESPTVVFNDVRAPATAPLDSRVRVEALLHVARARGRTVDVELRVDSLLVDRASRVIGRDDETLTVPLAFIPVRAGVARLRVASSIAGVSRGADAAIIVDVRDRRWSVLFYDARPSWSSTFLRRAVERDPRFVVTSRTMTSRNVSSDVGRPPARLDDLPSIDAYDAIIVGAPETLAENDMRGLEQFMRRRGGAVVLDLDQRDAPPPTRLTGVSRWTGASVDRPTMIRRIDGDSGALRAMDLAWPTRLPPGARVLAGDSARPLVWQIPVGAGRLVVNGALDAWRFRDPSESAFDDVWRGIVAEAANAAPPAIVATVAPSIVRPGESVDLHATLRDVVLSQTLPAHAAVAFALDGTPVHPWPGGVGRLDAELRAPRDTGIHHLAVTVNGTTVDVPVVVDRSAPQRTIPPTLFPRWIAAHGGTIVEASQLDDLAPRITRALRVAPRVEIRHPMRSPWWLVPFALALAAEWWLRRRRGLR
jgi:hypothetical protein